MTIVVVGIVAVPLALLINQQIKSVFVSQDLTMARNLARFEMEKINNTAYDRIEIGNFLSPDYPDYNYDVTRIVAYAQGDANSKESLKKITISVTKSNDTQIVAILITYLAKNVSYGL